MLDLAIYGLLVVAAYVILIVILAELDDDA